MRTASNNLINLLANSTVFYMAEIYSIVLSDNSALLYSALDRDISYNSANYNSNSVLLKRGRLSLRRGMEVDELDLEMYPKNGANIGNTAFLSAVRSGALDGARITLRRLFYASWNEAANGAETGAITLFVGNVSDIDPMGRAGLSLKIKSDKERFNIKWPMNVYLPSCHWMLYGAGCGANKTAFTSNGTVAAGSNNSVIKTNVAAANNYYDNGVIRFTSGNASGSVRTIKGFANANGTVTLVIPLTATPAANDTIQIYPGCDHSNDMCNNRFTNANNFRGFPYIPTPEAGV